jgi:tetratricopeptide (TPR) repeat protein
MSLGVMACTGCLAPRPVADQPISDQEPVAVVRGQQPTITTVRADKPALASDGRDHLAHAATHLDRGDREAALPHLRVHVAQHPDAVQIRAYLGELLYSLGQYDHARGQFLRVAADAARSPGEIRNHLVHVHTRLMEIALRQNDRYPEYFHRGVGLVLLVRQWDTDPATRDEIQVETTLVKAVAALREACRENPDDPEPTQYLAEALDRLGQPSAALSVRTRSQGLPLKPDAREFDSALQR